MVPRAVLMKTGLKAVNTARPVTTAHPKTTVYSARPMSHFSKSTVKRPYQIIIALTSKNSSQKVNTAKGKFYTARPNSAVVNVVRANQVNAVKASAWNMSYLLDFKEFDEGYVTFEGGAKGGKITGKGTLKTGKLDFEDVYFVKELQFNLFSVLQMCDKKNINNMYSVDMKNIVPKEFLTCLVAKATLDESMRWHRRLGHVKQHKAFCKSKIQNSITRPLFMLPMDMIGPTFMSSLMNKKYCLVVTDDYNRFTWVFFLTTKDETSGILKSFITEIQNLVIKKVKIIRYDNGTEFKNKVMSEFCKQKGVKREYSVARTPQ
ncbi:putative ribonuclease H-like domain-containing protein [Tanacetum coccineum]